MVWGGEFGFGLCMDEEREVVGMVMMVRGDEVEEDCWV